MHTFSLFQHNDFDIIGQNILEAKQSHIRSQKMQDCVLKILFNAGSQYTDVFVEASNIHELLGR